MTERVIVRGENITADLLLFRRFGVEGQGLIEALMDLNPGLSSLGPVIPLGTEVLLPGIPKPAPFTARKIVTLFG